MKLKHFPVEKGLVMTNSTGKYWLLPAVAVLISAGCGRSESGSAATASSQQRIGESSAGSQLQLQPPGDQSADEAVRDVILGLKQDKPEAVWHFLPAGYQRDINNLIHAFAQRMDPDVWKRSFALARRVTVILQAKKAWVLRRPLLKNAEQVTAEQLSASLDGILDLLSTLVNSEIADLERLKTIDGKELLAGIGGRVFSKLRLLLRLGDENPFVMLDDAKVTLIGSEGDRATVRIEPPGREPRDYEYVRVEGKWIPRNLAENWSQTISQARQKLASLSPAAFAEDKELALQKLDGYDRFLDRLEQAKTAEEFQLMLFEAYLQVAELLHAGQPSEAAVAEADAVLVVVNVEVDDETDEALTARLSELSDDPTESDTLSDVQKGSGTTRFKVLPVKDVKAFAKRIDFGRVVRIDDEKRTITVDLRSPQSPRR